MLKKVRRILSQALLVPIIATGCSAAASTLRTPGSSAAGPQVAASSAGLPITRALARRLPAGVFYFLTGPNPTSYNIWEILNTGNEIGLTHNDPGYGISDFAASPAGIIMADAAGGYDKIARLTSSGAEFLKRNAQGSSPAISASGQIAYVGVYGSKGNAAGSELMVKKSFNAPARVLTRQKIDITSEAWGPGQSLAILTGSHYPGTTGPTPKAIDISRSGKTETINTGLGKDLAALLWNEKQGGLAVWGWGKEGKVIDNNAHQYTLPTGWVPASWNPAGTELLVRKPGKELGLWSTKKPHSVVTIGALPGSPDIAKIVWLAHPAKL